MNTMKARLRFSYGTMNSGKSTHILTTTFNYEQNGIKFILLKPSTDTREGKSIVKSRTGLSRECVTIESNFNIYEYIKELKRSQGIEWVFVDEAQFLTETQVNQLSDVVDFLDIDVWCFGLRTDFKTHFFEGSRRLMEIADKLIEMKSSCKCGKKNIINIRYDINGNICTDGESVEVGDIGKYGTMCRACYKKMLKNNK